MKLVRTSDNKELSYGDQVCVLATNTVYRLVHAWPPCDRYPLGLVQLMRPGDSNFDTQLYPTAIGARFVERS
jgi:hypothetical protein